MNIREIKALLLLSLFVFSTISFAKVQDSDSIKAHEISSQNLDQLQKAADDIKSAGGTEDQQKRALATFVRNITAIPGFEDLSLQSDENLAKIAKTLKVAKSGSCDPKISVSLVDASGKYRGTFITTNVERFFEVCETKFGITPHPYETGIRSVLPAAPGTEVIF
jgi:hypothetical protein